MLEGVFVERLAVVEIETKDDLVGKGQLIGWSERKSG